MPRPWQLGVVLGLSVGAGVVLIGAVRYGLSAPLIVLGLVLAVTFGGLAVLGVMAPGAGRRTHLD